MASACKSSPFFSRTLFHDISPAIKELFERKQKSLFVEPPRKHYIDGPPQKSYIDVRTLDPATAQKSRSLGVTVSWEAQPHDLDSSDAPPWNEWRFTSINDLEALGDLVTGTQSSISTIFFIRQRNSYARLSLDRSLFESLIKRLDVFPKFIEFVLLFGEKSGENEISPPQCKLNFILQPEGVRKIRAFECAYALRFVEFNGRGGGKVPWSVRQTAVYHKFLPQGPSWWIFVSISRNAEGRLGEHFDQAASADINPFEAHVILIDTALANWRSYMIYLTERTNEQINKFVVASVTSKEATGIKLDFEERQRIKQIEDYVLDIFLMLDSTQDTVSCLLVKYQAYACLSQGQAEAYEDLVVLALLEKRREIELCRQKLRALHSKVKGTIQLLSSLLDLGNGHALKDLAEEARKDNVAMRMLTEKGTQDAAAVKVLTVITLIYLPASAVSNFFSTQLLQQRQDAKTGSYRLVLASNWWVFWAVSLPLTAFTLLVWWLWVRVQQIRTRAKAGKATSEDSQQQQWRDKIQEVLRTSVRSKRTSGDFEKAIPVDKLEGYPDGPEIDQSSHDMTSISPNEDFIKVIE